MDETMSQMPTTQQLLDLKGTMIAVPELLSLFGVRVRNYKTVPMISEALKAAGLSTVPSFAICGSQADVHVVALETAPPQELEEDEEELSPGTLPQHSFKIGDIPAACGGVESLPPNASLGQVTIIMRTRRYSQLPIIEDLSKLIGVVTWSSVAGMYQKGVAPSLANAMEKDSLPVAEVHHELFAYLPMVSQHGYLLVRDNSGTFSGIVTGTDITERFEATARPFFLVGEIEFRLRKCLGAALSPDAIRAVQRGKPEQRTGKITDLMFGDYVRLLDGHQKSQALSARADQNWAALGWAVDRIEFVKQLDRVRDIRNKIAHFDAEPLSEQKAGELHQFAGLLKHLT